MAKIPAFSTAPQDALKKASEMGPAILSAIPRTAGTTMGTVCAPLTAPQNFMLKQHVKERAIHVPLKNAILRTESVGAVPCCALKICLGTESATQNAIIMSVVMIIWIVGVLLGANLFMILF